MSNPEQAITILDKEGMRRALTRIAHEILEHNGGTEGLILMGVRTRGLPLARRIADLITQFEGVEVPVHELDVTPYRDDKALRAPKSTADSEGRRAATSTRDSDTSPTGPDVEGRACVIVDDVFYTGRTVRAAIDAVMAMGRPA